MGPCRQRGEQRGGVGLEGCNLPGRLWLPPAGDLPHLLSAGPVVFAAVSVTEHCWAGLVDEGCGFRKLWRPECRGPCGRASESLRPWVDCRKLWRRGCRGPCGPASESLRPWVQVDCRKLWRSERGCPCGHASESLRPWAVVECCGAASAGAPVGVHPSCASLGLLPGVGAGPEPGVLRECLDWLVLATPVSIAVPASDALCLFLG